MFIHKSWNLSGILINKVPQSERGGHGQSTLGGGCGGSPGTMSCCSVGTQQHLSGPGSTDTAVWAPGHSTNTWITRHSHNVLSEMFRKISNGSYRLCKALEWSKFPSSHTGTTALEPSMVAISLRVGRMNTRGKEYPVQTALHYRNGRICLGP